MPKEIGPRERQLREMREARLARKPNPFEDAARGRDPAPALREQIATIKPKARKAKKAKRR